MILVFPFFKTLNVSVRKFDHNFKRFLGITNDITLEFTSFEKTGHTWSQTIQLEPSGMMEIGWETFDRAMVDLNGWRSSRRSLKDKWEMIGMSSEDDQKVTGKMTGKWPEGRPRMTGEYPEERKSLKIFYEEDPS
ncbi:unnamed protein product [Ilex paraguariensis]|uniref:Uncharacterized protein n=1 Tax=Ilex paraguariensis TaxID=185542 RepID=A0ABC8S7K9_9AQUA